MNSIKCYKDCNNFIDHPLAPLFYRFVKTLEKRGFYTIIFKIIIEMQRAAVSDEKNKFEQLLQKL